jgi:hypothetical protein
VKPGVLARHKRAQFDFGKFTQFSWLVVKEEVQLQQPRNEIAWLHCCPSRSMTLTGSSYMDGAFQKF